MTSGLDCPHWLREAVNESCSCGGCGPDDPEACGACRMYHAILPRAKRLEALEAVAEAALLFRIQQELLDDTRPNFTPTTLGKVKATFDAMLAALDALPKEVP